MHSLTVVAVSHGDKIALPPDPRLAAELTAAIWTLKRDRILIESKADIRNRLGFSPDLADAVALAWHNRKQALFMQMHGSKLDTEWAYQADDYDPFEPPAASRGQICASRAASQLGPARRASSNKPNQRAVANARARKQRLSKRGLYASVRLYCRGAQ